MAQTKKSSSLSSVRFNNKILLLFLLVFAGIGGWMAWQAFAAPASTRTVLRSGVSKITPESGSSNYVLTQDSLNYEVVSVAKISANGMLSFGGKGGGTTAPPVAKQNCYVLRVDRGTTATVQLLTGSGGIVRKTLLPWPYDAEPVPYNQVCTGAGNIPNKNVPHIHVLSGGPVYFYEMQSIVDYPYY